MFEYYDGYEIDGSDTSYHILTPEIEKLKEVVNAYLQQKIIRKDIPIKITRINSKAKGELYNKSYYKHELDLFWEDVLGSNIKYIEISYAYANPYQLYPEVKRELLDYIIEDFHAKESELNCPVFWPFYNVRGYMTLYLDSDRGEKWYSSYDDICGDDYCDKYADSSKRFIDVDCLLGGPTVLKYYAIKKLSIMFPELNISPKNSVENITYYDANLKDSIYEEIDIQSMNLYETVKRILDMDCVELYNNNPRSKNPLHNRYYCQDFESYRQYQYEYSTYEDKEVMINDGWTKEESSQWETLARLYKKYNGETLKGYIAFTKHIAKLKFVNDEEYDYETSIQIKISKQEKYDYGRICFFRNQGSIHLKLLVPYEIRTYIEKQLRLS